MTCMGAVTPCYPNSRTKSNMELMLRLNRPDWAVVLAQRYRVDILSQRRSDHWSHFPLRAMQNDVLQIQVLYKKKKKKKEKNIWFLFYSELIQAQTCLPEVGYLNYHQATQESNYLTCNIAKTSWSCCFCRWNRWSLNCWFPLLKTQM